MISEDKMSHILHLMLDGVEKAKMATFPDKERAIREARKSSFKYISEVNAVGEVARKRVLAMKNPPPEFSSEYDILYRKFYEEEMRKKGG